VIIIKKQNYPHFDLQRHLQISSQNTPSSITISRVHQYTIIGSLRSACSSSIPPTQKSRHFFDRRNLRERATVPWLEEEEEEGILPSFFLRRLPCARAPKPYRPTSNLAHWKPTRAFQRIAVQCMHAYSHTRTYVRARATVCRTYIYSIDMYIFYTTYVLNKNVLP